MATDFKYVENITGGVPRMNLFGHIGRDANNPNGIVGAEFANEIRMLETIGHNRIKIHVNSIGGSVLEGIDIFTAIKTSGMDIEMHNEFLAASIAGVVMHSGTKRYMNDFSRLMIHKVSFGGSGSSDDPNTQQVLDNFNAQLKTLLINNSNLSQERLDEIFESNLDVWLEPHEALEAGLIDQIISTDRDRRPADIGYINNDVSEIYKVYNSLLINNDNSMNLEKISNSLSLDNGNESQIVNKIGELTNSLNDSVNTITKLENSVKEAEVMLEETSKTLSEVEKELTEATDSLKVLEVAKTESTDKAEALTNELAETMVENAIAIGKFDRAQKDTLVASAKKDIDLFKNLCSASTIANPKLDDAVVIKNDVGVPYTAGAQMADIQNRTKNNI